MRRACSPAGLLAERPSSSCRLPARLRRNPSPPPGTARPSTRSDVPPLGPSARLAAATELACVRNLPCLLHPFSFPPLRCRLAPPHAPPFYRPHKTQHHPSLCCSRLAVSLASFTPKSPTHHSPPLVPSQHTLLSSRVSPLVPDPPPLPSAPPLQSLYDRNAIIPDGERRGARANGRVWVLRRAVDGRLRLPLVRVGRTPSACSAAVGDAPVATRRCQPADDKLSSRRGSLDASRARAAANAISTCLAAARALAHQQDDRACLREPVERVPVKPPRG